MDAPTYDMEAVYDAEIAPLMAQIIAVCQRENMPFIASFGYAYDPNDTDKQMFCTSYSPGPDSWVHPKIFAALKAVRATYSFATFTVTSP